MTAPYEGMYGKLKFPPFKFQEYPKIVRDAAGKAIGTVANRTEELEHLASINSQPTDQVTLDVSNERDDLAKAVAVKDAQIKELTDKMNELIAQVAKTQGAAQGKLQPAATPEPATKLSPTFTPPTPLKPGEPGAAVPGKDKPIIAAADGTAPLSSGGQKAGD